MENASEALKMAGQYLLFIMALSIAIYSLSQLRATSQVIFESRDREFSNAYAEDIAYIQDNGGKDRIVGIETIVPTMYRSFKENYKIVFKFKDSSYCLYRKGSITDTIGNPINTIDLEKDVTGNDKQKEEFLQCLLYGPNNTQKANYRKNEFIYFTTDEPNGLYQYMKGKEFREKLGVYYQEEVEGDTQTPDANKTEKRIITYEEI